MSNPIELYHYLDHHTIIINQCLDCSYEAISSVLDACLDQLPIHLDLSKVDTLNSAFIGTIISFKKNHPTINITIVNPNQTALEIIKLIKLDKLFPIQQ